jgi:hypothetical protein
MRIFLVLGLSLAFANVAYAKKNCTDQPKEEWMSIDAFKEMVKKQGYVIRKLKQPGTCYEIYGKDKDGKKIEIYFNPVNGKIVKSK